MKKQNKLWLLSLTLLVVNAFLSCSNGESVMIYDDGTTSNGSTFLAIDNNTFYLNNIEYTLVKENLVVSGYDEKRLKDNANIASSISLKGNKYEVLEIGDYAFSSCKNLITINIPKSVISIGKYAFSRCDNLTSVSIPNNVTSIGEYAFEDCTGLTSINIPHGVTEIGEYAFEGCSSLTSITIPSSVTSIGFNAFYDCFVLSPNFKNKSHLKQSRYFGDLWGLTLCDEETSEGLLIRYQIKDNEIVRCRPNAFSVTIPNSVTSIGMYAFEGCENLTSITIPSSVTSIGSNAFSSCSNLTSVSIPNSVTSIGRYAFEGCSSLTSITIPSSVTSIGSNAFQGCYVLFSKFINNSQQTDENVWGLTLCDEETSDGLFIKDSIIVRCQQKASSITIPNSVTSIGNNAFSGCKSLTSISIPDNVTSIGYYTFAGCTGLTSISIPDNVTSIGEEVFYNCKGLKSIHVKWKEPLEISNYESFDWIYDVALYVPVGTIESYKAVEPWKNFKKIIEE